MAAVGVNHTYPTDGNAKVGLTGWSLR